MSDDRRQAMLLAVGELIRVHDEWEADPEGPGYITSPFEGALNHAVAVCCHGDVPADCREVATAMDALRTAWNRYQEGDRLPGAVPTGEFWSSFRGVLAAFNGAENPNVRPLEPVHLLYESMRSYPNRDLQIARMYGTRQPDGRGGFQWVGPFFGPNGVPRADLIHRQAQAERGVKGVEPVLPADWVHPEHVAASARAKAAAEGRLSRLESRAGESSPKIDPATIEDLLREGQYPDVIAKVKGVPMADVLREAERLALQPATRPNLAAERSAHEPRFDLGENQQSDPVAEPGDRDVDEPVDAEVDAEPGDDPDADTGFDLRGAVEDAMTDPASKDLGAGEIAALIREQYPEAGDVDGRKVAGIMRSLKRGAKPAEAVAAG